MLSAIERVPRTGATATTTSDRVGRPVPERPAARPTELWERERWSPALLAARLSDPAWLTALRGNFALPGLRATRQARGLTRRALEMLAGLNGRSIQRWEEGKSANAVSVVRLAAVLETDWATLTGRRRRGG